MKIHVKLKRLFPGMEKALMLNLMEQAWWIIVFLNFAMDITSISKLVSCNISTFLFVEGNLSYKTNSI